MQNRFIVTPYFIDEPRPEIEQLAAAAWQMNKPEFAAGDRYSRMSALHLALADFTAKTLIEGHRPVSVNGDCCATIGMMAGLQRAGVDPLLIWLDAHGDFNTFETTPSQFIGGMPLAMLVGKGEQALMEKAGTKPISEGQIILADARDLDIAEGVAVRSSKVRHIHYMDDLIKHNLGDRPIYVHFDTDILNPEDAPAVAYVAEGGPKTDALVKVMQHLASTGRVVAVSMTVWNMASDVDKKTQEACMACFKALMG